MTAIGELAIDRAQHQSAHGPRFGTGQCMMRTRILFGAPAVGDFDGDGSPDAEDGWKFAKFKHRFNGDYQSVPRGVPFWWSGGSHDNGHVVVTLGNGLCESTDIIRNGFYDCAPLAAIHEKWGLTPLGWTEDIDGVRVWTPPTEADLKEARDMALLADLTAVCRAHDVGRVKGARVLLRESALHHKGASLLRIMTARRAIKGMDN